MNLDPHYAVCSSLKICSELETTITFDACCTSLAHTDLLLLQSKQYGPCTLLRLRQLRKQLQEDSDCNKVRLHIYHEILMTAMHCISCFKDMASMLVWVAVKFTPYIHSFS